MGLRSSVSFGHCYTDRNFAGVGRCGREAGSSTSLGMTGPTETYKDRDDATSLMRFDVNFTLRERRIYDAYFYHRN